MDNDRINLFLSQVASELRAWLEANVLTAGVAGQVVLTVAIAATAFVVQKLIRPHAEAHLRQIDAPPTIQRLLRAAAAMVGMIVFLVLAMVATVMMQRYFPGAGTHVLTIFISLAMAWVVIQLSASLIAHRAAARAVAWLAWITAALSIVGLLAPLIASLESVGMTLGSARITLWSVLSGLVLLAVLLWAALLLTSVIMQRLRTSAVVTPRTQVLLGKIVKFSLIVMAVVIALASVGVNLAALAVFAGGLGVGIGIGLQRQVSNLLSGLFLLLDKSIKPGDVIEVGQTYGWVHEIGARYVGVVTRDNKEILIPNDTFVTDNVVNWSHNDRDVRLEVAFSVSYDADPHRVREIAAAAAARSARVSVQRPPLAHVTGFGDSGINFLLRFWISDPEGGVTNVRGEVLLALWDAFKANGIVIPFPHRYLIFADDAAGGRKASGGPGQVQ